MRNLMAIVFVLFSLQNCYTQGAVYKVVLMRAAPGRLLPLIELLKEDISKHKSYGIQKPYLMRHSRESSESLGDVINGGHIGFESREG